MSDDKPRDLRFPDTTPVFRSLDDVKLTDGKLDDAEPVEVVPDDIMPAVTTALEVAPVETMASDAPLADEKPVEAASVIDVAEAPSAIEKPVEEKSVEVKPDEAKPADDKQTDTKPLVEQPVNVVPADMRMSVAAALPVEKTEDEKLVEAMLADIQISEAKAADEKPVGENLEGAKPSEITPRDLTPQPLFQIKDMTVRTQGSARPELENFSLSLDPGSTVTLLGETGSGKEALLRVLTGLGERSEDVSGTIKFGTGDIKPLARNLTLSLRSAFLPGPLTPVLNPHVSALSQLALIVARKLNQPRGSARAELALALSRLPDAPDITALDVSPAQVAPEHLAAGLLACALAQTPELVIAADPLAELSPAHARALAAALKAEQKRLGFALLYAAASVDAAHILGGNVVVLRSGRIVEEGPVSRLATAQSHAYTQILFRAVPIAIKEPPKPRSGPRGESVLQVQGIQLATHGKADARDKLTFELRRGGSLALLGEEGSGRRALTRAVLGLDPIPMGRIVFDQIDIGILSSAMMARLRRRIAFVTGDDDALDPRLTIHDTVSEPLRAYLRMPGDQVARNRDAALKRVGLAALPGTRTVASLSRFDRRRLQIARAIVGAPLLAVIDEPLRGLDAFAQSVMRDLLRSLRDQENPAFLVITSDFALAQATCEEAFVFKDGRIVERGAIASLLRAPKDDHTRKLIAAGAPKSALSPERAEG